VQGRRARGRASEAAVARASHKGGRDGAAGARATGLQGTRREEERGGEGREREGEGGRGEGSSPWGPNPAISISKT
jgi:hypothetical protein